MSLGFEIDKINTVVCRSLFTLLLVDVKKIKYPPQSQLERFHCYKYIHTTCSVLSSHDMSDETLRRNQSFLSVKDS